MSSYGNILRLRRATKPQNSEPTAPKRYRRRRREEQANYDGKMVSLPDIQRKHRRIIGRAIRVVRRELAQNEP